jgi:hypothetical protein
MRSAIVRLSGTAAVLIGLLTNAASASVLVVDAGGGGSYTQIQPAIDAAVDGDTILVKSGIYSWFAVNDKALAIVGDAGAIVHINGAVRVRNLATEKTLVLENVNAVGIASSDPLTVFGLHLSNNQGHVRVQACKFVGLSSSPGGFYGYDAIVIEACSDVSLTRTTSLGGSGAVVGEPSNAPSGAGLTALNSTIAIHATTLRGGTGNSASPSSAAVDGANGGDGCDAYGTTIFAAGSSFLAGNGGGAGWGLGLSYTYGGDGGNGMTLSGGTRAILLDDIFSAGVGGPAGNGDSSPGQFGHQRVASQGSQFRDLPGTAVRVGSSTPVRENTPTTLSFTGAPGEQAELLISRTSAHHFDAGESGVLLLGSPVRVITVGVVPASGILSVQIPVPGLDPGVEAAVLHMQARFIDPQGNTVLSGPSGMVILSHLF